MFTKNSAAVFQIARRRVCDNNPECKPLNIWTCLKLEPTRRQFYKGPTSFKVLGDG